jgi:hypothetical protein
MSSPINARASFRHFADTRVLNESFMMSRMASPLLTKLVAFLNLVEFLFPEVWLQLLPLTCYYSIRNALSVISTAYYFRVQDVCPAKCFLGLQRCILLSSAHYWSLEMPFRSSASRVAFESGLLAPRSVFSVFSTTYYFWVRAVCPSKCFLGLQRSILLLIAGYWSLKMPFRSSAPRVAFECGLLAHRSVFSVFSTAYYFRVRAICPSKCFLGVQHRILLSSAGYWSLEMPFRSSALCVSFKYGLLAPRSVFSVFSTAFTFECG